MGRRLFPRGRLTWKTTATLAASPIFGIYYELSNIISINLNTNNNKEKPNIIQSI
jgi:hypothetical protein